MFTELSSSGSENGDLLCCQQSIGHIFFLFEIFTLPWHLPAMKHKKTVANIFQQRHSSRDWSIDIDYTPRNEVRWVYWNHHVRLSVRPSVVRIWVSGA